jgi:phosphate:Na+ symporter
MLQLVNEALTQMLIVISGRREDLIIAPSLEIEHDINTMRDALKAEIVSDLNAHQYSYTLGTLYGDLVSACEELGDYVMNVVEARLGKHLLVYNGLQMNLDHKTVSIDGTMVSLTRTEYALLHLLLANRGQVLSRQQLMDTIWAGVIVTDRTVNVNITRLRKKLGPYAQNIVSRQGFGYVFDAV